MITVYVLPVSVFVLFAHFFIDSADLPTEILLQIVDAGRMLILLPDQRCQSTEGNGKHGINRQ